MTWVVVVEGVEPLAAWEQRIGPLAVPAGYPRPHDGAIAVGACADREAAERVRALLATVSPDATVVEADLAEACPRLVPGELPAGVEVLRRPAGEGSAWVVTRPGDDPPMCPQLRLAFTWSSPAGAVSRTWEGGCQPPDPADPDDVGFSSRFDAVEVVEGFQRLPLFVVREHSYDMGVALAFDRVFGLLCGEWREVVPRLDAGGALGTGPSVTHVVDVSDGHVRVRSWSGPASGADSGADGEGPPDTERRWRVDPRSCRAEAIEP